MKWGLKLFSLLLLTLLLLCILTSPYATDMSNMADAIEISDFNENVNEITLKSDISNEKNSQDNVLL